MRGKMKKGKDAIKEKAQFYGMVRFAVLAILVLGQISVLIIIARLLTEQSAYIYTICQFFAIVIIIGLVSNGSSPAFRLSWICTVAVLPVFGLLLYIVWGRNSARKKIRPWTGAADQDPQEALRSREISDKIGTGYPCISGVTERLSREGYFAYGNTEIVYYQLGELMFEALIEELEKAERFIFLQYFIVADGVIWRRIFEIIDRKARSGVDVRLSYDDFGSIVTIPKSIKKDLLAANIKLVRFNPIYTHIHRLFVNYRNHQKIAVVDGDVAFAGGINIGDEYANLYRKHGHWKDSAVKLTGEGVWGLTKIFLEMWKLAGGEPPHDISEFMPRRTAQAAGYCQPFADGPDNPRNPAENIYKQMIYGSRKYVYITSPYLAVDDDMLNALRTAARSNVDVRIMLPAISDHWYTRVLNNSYYGTLISAGVKIYEYTPGFLHAKSILVDDYAAVVGSMNLDFRSLYINFECGVWLCATDGAISALKGDMLSIIESSAKIELSEWRKRPLRTKALQKFLRIMSPLT